MTFTVADFRLGFPEFGNTSEYTDSLIQFWLDQAVKLVNPAAWGSSYDLGLGLFTAHNVVIEKRNMQAAANPGGVPGMSMSGPLSSKAVGPVSASYDTSAAMEPDAGHWNLTNFGTRFAQLARMFGAGPIQVSGFCG